MYFCYGFYNFMHMDMAIFGEKKPLHQAEVSSKGVN
ncbi:hypothetical protein LEJE111609_13290 [Lelliottia jeotgali]